MGFNIERTNKPFVVKSPYKPSGDQPKAIEELAERIENGENDVVSWALPELAKLPPRHGLLNVCNARR